MNYETSYLIGNNTNTRRKTRKAIASTIGEIQPMDTTTQRCQPDTEGQTKISSGIHAANNFLKSKFLPKLAVVGENEGGRVSEKTERCFYISLSEVAKRYRITPMQTKEYAYPYNIVLALWNLESNLKNKTNDLGKIHLAQSKKKTFLSVKEKYDTQTTLYYIPVIPLYKMLNDSRHKKNAHLLLSVCTYLYKVANIPYYRQEDSYLYWQYEIMNEWIYNDEPEDGSFQSELRQAEVIGDIIEKKLRNNHNLNIFEQHLTSFIRRGNFDDTCWQIALDAFALYKEYPKQSIYKNAPISEKNPYDDEDNYMISMDKYISFCSETKGNLYSNIAECINNEFNEYGDIAEPTIYRAIDGSRIAGNNFDFEKRLFKLLEDLCDLLYDY